MYYLACEEVYNMVVTKDTIIGDILAYDREAAILFMSIGMNCVGCGASQYETIEQACGVHGIDVDDLVADLNEFLSSKKEG